MRHRKKINHLGRTKSHRDSMLSNMASSLILNKRIYTTVAKAKSLRGFVEPLLTKSKDDTTHSRRIVFSYLQDKNAVTELFRNVSVKIADRPGGYTRILKTGMRIGDSADMCFIELVDYNELMLESADKKDKKGGRKRRGTKKAGAPETPKTKTPEATQKEVSDPEIIEEKVEDAFEEDTMADEQEISETLVEEAPDSELQEAVAEEIENPSDEETETAEEPTEDSDVNKSDDEIKKDQ
jgi:large subunit ribosomal protein L17